MTEPLDADYFDGRSARPSRVRVWREPQCLRLVGEGLDRTVTLAEVDWPERTRHGTRIAHLRDGSSLQAVDRAAWDAWTRAAGLERSWVVGAQQDWRSTLVAVLLLVLVAAAGYRWGVPWTARAVLAAVPQRIDEAVGAAAYDAIRERWLATSRLPAERRQALAARFAAAVDRFDDGRRPGLPYSLHFHAGRGSGPEDGLGANAFALPGGVIVLTDELAGLFADREEVLIGVLAHELGHVRGRHGMRSVVQAGLIGAAAAVAWGDFSGVLATVPVWLGHAAYSRDLEREADEAAIALLQANGIDPAVMALLFERLAEQRGGGAGSGASALGIALASHPADEERIRRFRAAGARP